MKLKILFSTVVLLYLLLINFSIVFANPPEIYGEGAVLIDAKTGVVLYDKNMHEQYYPASITKIMTTLLALENSDESDRVVMSRNAVYGIEPGSSHIAMDVDETLSMEDALYAVMLNSANEVSMAVAERIGGSVDGFAAMMTERAKELGASNTSFVNPHGLHSENHYATAYDMALIMKEAVTNDIFLKIISTRSYKIPPTEKQPDERPLYNNHKMISQGQYFYEYAVGGKTGFTDEAGNTLVTYAVKDDIELISVIMKSGLNRTYSDTEALMEYGFNLYRSARLFDKDNFSDTVPLSIIKYGKLIETGEAYITPDRSLTLKVPSQITDKNIYTEAHLPDTLFEPLEVGTKAGSLSIMYDGFEIAEVDLIVDDFTIKENLTAVKAGGFGAENERILESSELIPLQTWLLSVFAIIALALIAAGAVIRKYIKS